jgi:hypothetical protein
LQRVGVARHRPQVSTAQLAMTTDPPQRRITRWAAGADPVVTTEAEGPKRPASGLDSFEREILVFVLNWSRCGGAPAEEVIPRFGIPPDEFDGRLNQILGAGLRRDLDDDDRRLLAHTVAALRTRAPLRSRRPAMDS